MKTGKASGAKAANSLALALLMIGSVLEPLHQCSRLRLEMDCVILN